MKKADKQSLRIAYIVPHFRIYGGIRRIIEITNRLTERGHDVELLAWENTVCNWIEKKSPAFDIARIKHQRYDVICFSLETQHKDALRFKDHADLVVYYVLHYGALYKEPRMCKDSYAIPEFYKICNSNWTAKMVAQDIDYLPYVVNGAVNPDHFHVVDTEKEYDILCYGNDREWKGTRYIEKSAELAGLRLEKYDGKGLKQVDMAKEYSKARVFCSGSRLEGWNQPGLEAMACGVPLVITDDGGSREYAIDGYNCLVVPWAEPEAMAKAVRRVLGDDELRNRLIKNGLDTASLFNWDRTTDKFESIVLTKLDEIKKQS